MKLVRVFLAVAVVAAIACGKKNDNKDEATPEPAAPEAKADEPSGGPPPAEPAPEPSGGDEGLPPNPLAPTGDNIDRLCDWYGEAKRGAEGGDADPKDVDSCKQMMASRKPGERQKIADCANACGDMESVAYCFDDFGKDGYPPCEPEGDDDDGEE